jgi:hypothetical protein
MKKILQCCILIGILAPAYARDLEPALDTAIETLPRQYKTTKTW